MKILIAEDDNVSDDVCLVGMDVTRLASHEIAAEPPEERFQNVATKLVADKFTGPPRGPSRKF